MRTAFTLIDSHLKNTNSMHYCRTVEVVFAGANDVLMVVLLPEVELMLLLFMYTEESPKTHGNAFCERIIYIYYTKSNMHTVYI